jgi:NTP pyrophosphatase (non-canonical NTP hydrolase)
VGTTKQEGTPCDWTQGRISQWAEETFGPVSSNARVAARANEEMAELLRALTADDKNPGAAAEIADVMIVLYRLADRLGVDVQDQVNKKMEINAARTWSRSGDGHGYHVRPKEDKIAYGQSAIDGLLKPDESARPRCGYINDGGWRI